MCFLGDHVDFFLYDISHFVWIFLISGALLLTSVYRDPHLSCQKSHDSKLSLACIHPQLVVRSYVLVCLYPLPPNPLGNHFSLSHPLLNLIVILVLLPLPVSFQILNMY